MAKPDIEHQIDRNGVRNNVVITNNPSPNLIIEWLATNQLAYKTLLKIDPDPISEELKTSIMQMCSQ